jgi:hypothetical protein
VLVAHLAVPFVDEEFLGDMMKLMPCDTAGIVLAEMAALILPCGCHPLGLFALLSDADASGLISLYDILIHVRLASFLHDDADHLKLLGREGHLRGMFCCFVILLLCH